MLSQGCLAAHHQVTGVRCPERFSGEVLENVQCETAFLQERLERSKLLIPPQVLAELSQINWQLWDVEEAAARAAQPVPAKSASPSPQKLESGLRI